MSKNANSGGMYFEKLKNKFAIIAKAKRMGLCIFVEAYSTKIRQTFDMWLTSVTAVCFPTLPALFLEEILASELTGVRLMDSLVGEEWMVFSEILRLSLDGYIQV